jgi:hypothetical protein
MPTDTTKAQEKVLQAVRESQDASVQAVRRWSEGVASVVPTIPDLFAPERPEQAFAFVTRLWASQWEFATKLLEAAAGPLSQAAGDGMQRAASEAASQTSSQAARAAAATNKP